MTGKRLKVDCEWDTLCEVVVGYPHIWLGNRIPRYAQNYMPAAVLAGMTALVDQHTGETLGRGPGPSGGDHHAVFGALPVG